MDTLSVIKLMPSTKDEIESFVTKTVSMVKEGNLNALELAAYLKAIEITTDKIREQIKEEMLKEHSKYGEKTIDYSGFKIEKTELGINYDYSRCNDSIWQSLMEHKGKVMDEIKIQEAFLKTVKPGMEVYNGDGDRLNPPIKTSTTGLKFTLK